MKFLLPIEAIKAYGPEITLFWKRAYKDGSEIKWRVFITVNEIRDILVGKADTESEAEKMIDLLIKVVKAEKEKSDMVETIHEKLGILLEDLPYQETKEKKDKAKEIEELRQRIKSLKQEIKKKDQTIEDLLEKIKYEVFTHQGALEKLKEAERRESFNKAQYKKIQEQVSSLLEEKESSSSTLMTFIAMLILVFAMVGLAFVITSFAGGVVWKW